MDVWAVVFSNYEPAEVCALYDNEAAASSHASDLNGEGDGGWGVAQWNVRSEYPPKEM